jgi:hypothetical protein
VLARAAVLVVVTVVAMVSLSSLVNHDDRVFRNRLSKRLVSRTAVFKVQALEEGMAEPIDQAEGDATPQNAAEAKECPTQIVHVSSCVTAGRPSLN